MMIIVQSIFVLTFLTALIRGQATLFVFSTLIFPLVCYGLSLVGIAILSPYALLLVLIVTGAGTYYVLGDSLAATNRKDTLLAGSLLAGVFLYALYLSAVCWPDFFPMGERLRDFSLLSSGRSAPYGALEPWFAGYNTNYYLYWYRAYGLFGVMLDIPTRFLYHFAISWSLALYVYSVFFLLESLGVTRRGIKIFVPLLAAFGSNFAGITFWLKNDSSWWGPSRVIKGAINEFPAWSFVLGDLHPHYLSLSLLGIIVGIVVRGLSSIRPTSFVLTIVFTLIIVPLFLYGANAWEVPLVFAVNIGVAVALFSLKKFPNWSIYTIEKRDWIMGGVLVLLIPILLKANAQITPQDYPWSLVGDGIDRTSTMELFLHFGLPLTALSIFIATQAQYYRILWAFLLLLLALCGPSWAFLLALLLGVCMLAFAQPQFFSRRPIFALAAVGLVLVIVPEFIFLNDPYGGENERMNTIFKFYMPAWTLLHVSCFTLILESLPIRWTKMMWIERCLVIGAILMPFGFFIAVQPLRYSESYKKNIGVENSGFKNLDDTYPGGEVTIRKLELLPPGIVLEAQGDAYNWTTHIATLSEHPAYLGWTNHIRLLIPQGDEITRREKVSDEIYNDVGSCEEIKKLILAEKIQYVVIGPREKLKYPNIQRVRFSCLKPVIESGPYTVVSAP